MDRSAVQRLTERRRIDGRVKQEHVRMLATLRPHTLGQPTALETRAFWQEAMAALERYQNRLPDEQLTAIIAALHARVPMPSVEGVENAVTDTLNDEAACMRRRIASSESMIAARKGTIRAGTCQ
jgi:hypothetical protein